MDSTLFNSKYRYVKSFHVQSESDYFTPEKVIKPFTSEPVVMRQLSGRRIRNTEMTTFGKEKTDLVTSSDAKVGKPDIEHSVKKYLNSVHYDSSPIVLPSPPRQRPGAVVLTKSKQQTPIIQCLKGVPRSKPDSSFSSSHTDDLSTLGVPADEVDFLGGVLEVLEPSLEVKRRSRNFDNGSRRRYPRNTKIHLDKCVPASSDCPYLLGRKSI